METRTLLRRDFSYAMRMLRDAMDELIKISGSSGLMDNNSAQRCWRDVHAISSHVVMNWDVPAENFGRAEFGLPLNPGLSDVLMWRSVMAGLILQHVQFAPWTRRQDC